MSEGDDRPRPRLSGRRDRWPGREAPGQHGMGAGQQDAEGDEGGADEPVDGAEQGTSPAAGDARRPPPGAATGDGDAGSPDVPAGDGPR